MGDPGQQQERLSSDAPPTTMFTSASALVTVRVRATGLTACCRCTCRHGGGAGGWGGGSVGGWACGCGGGRPCQHLQRLLPSPTCTRHARGGRRRESSRDPPPLPQSEVGQRQSGRQCSTGITQGQLHRRTFTLRALFWANWVVIAAEAILSSC